jgi:uncharacterized protein
VRTESSEAETREIITNFDITSSSLQGRSKSGFLEPNLLVGKAKRGYNLIMRFEWDEEKNQTNIRKHGFDFADAWEIFTLPMLIAPDDREDYGEDRWIGIGLLRGTTVVVVYVERSQEVIRIISLRKALAHERSEYEKILKDRLGPDWHHDG